MSELELRFNEPSGRSRHGRRRAGPPPPRQQSRKRKKKSKKRRSGGRSFLAFFLVLLLLGVLAAAGLWAYSWVRGALTTPDYAGPGTGSVVVEVRAGDSGAIIANTLFEADVIKSPQAFIEACDAEADQCRNIQPGTYELRLQMSAAEAVRLLLDLDSRVVELVTVPEGLTKFHTYQVLSEGLDIPAEEFEAAEEEALALVPDWWFTRTDGKEADGSIEGFLFPDSYDFPPDVTARSALETLVNQFLSVTGEMDFADRVETERQISPYEALIAASIAQAEAGTPEDLGKVARVAYNRVYRTGMPLQMDVTTNYGLLARGDEGVTSGQMTFEMLNDPSNLYSTHAHTGWTPGPINSPGRAALEAAMEPPEGNWLFFVAINPETGESAFAETNAEHEANIRIACQNGVELSQC
jgi:UPF0755 protein